MPLFTNEQLVQSTDLDIRDLSSASDSIQAIGPLTDTQLRATPVPISGTITANAGTGFGASVGVATVTNVSVGTTATTLSASNSAKTKVVVFNESGTLFVKLGSAASSISYSYRLPANTTAEIEGYFGLITAVKASGTTSVLVTEFGI